MSVTNGDIGHWQSAGGPLALVRNGEAARARAYFDKTVEMMTHGGTHKDGGVIPYYTHRKDMQAGYSRSQPTHDTARHFTAGLLSYLPCQGGKLVAG